MLNYAAAAAVMYERFVLLLLSKEGDYGFCHQERSIPVL
jgi:hypothetical protein